MKRRQLIKTALAAVSTLAVSEIIGKPLSGASNMGRPGSGGGKDNGYKEAIAPGPFRPEWGSLKNYEVPDWFRDAKFGIWAHWGPQCQPEHGDWYARQMYIEGNGDYEFHLKKYGHPSKFGFKDVIHTWKAENWNPDELVKLYKDAGAKYFFALANHHDNFDNYNSKYQSWNSTRQGPEKDLIGGWAKAARANGLKLGVSVHAAHAWSFYEKSQKADVKGPYAGIPYDGNIKKDAAPRAWWEGLDPQELYNQNHTPAVGGDNDATFGAQWDWSHQASQPDEKYCRKFYNRTIDLINKYKPDMVYFDDTILPLYPVSNVGLEIAAHLYNSSMQQNGGKLEAVLTGKVLDPEQRKCMVWDIERGQSNMIEPLPWQTDTCLGDWHYDRRIYDRKGYKTSKTVIHTLIDVVSKNGNLLLNVPVRGDGTIDSEERAIVNGIGAWLKVNGEAIYETRPWKVFGEGPAIKTVAAISAQGFNEGKGAPFTGEDLRFTVKGDQLFIFALGLPKAGKASVSSLGLGSAHYPGKIGSISLLGTDQPLAFNRTDTALEILMPEIVPAQEAYVFRVLPG